MTKILARLPSTVHLQYVHFLNKILLQTNVEVHPWADVVKLWECIFEK